MKNAREKILICFTAVCIVVILFSPIKAGLIGVSQNIFKYGCILICLFVVFIIIVKKMLTNKKVDKNRVVCLIVISFLLLMYMHKEIISIKGLLAGTQTVQVTEYECEYHKSVRSPAKYTLEVYNNGESTSIYITREMYFELKDSNNELMVTYYPYVNIVDEIRVIN